MTQFITSRCPFCGKSNELFEEPTCLNKKHVWCFEKLVIYIGKNWLFSDAWKHVVAGCTNSGVQTIKEPLLLGKLNRCVGHWSTWCFWKQQKTNWSENMVHGFYFFLGGGTGFQVFLAPTKQPREDFCWNTISEWRDLEKRSIWTWYLFKASRIIGKNEETFPFHYTTTATGFRVDVVVIKMSMGSSNDTSSTKSSELCWWGND